MRTQATLASPRHLRRASSPFFGLDLAAEFDRLMRDVDGRSPARLSDRPAVTVAENDHEFLVTIDLPGVAKDAVELSILDDILTVKGTRSASRDETTDKAKPTTLRREIATGAFAREVRLPSSVAPEKAEATLANGVLAIRLPKAESATPRRIDVQSG